MVLQGNLLGAQVLLDGNGIVRAALDCGVVGDNHAFSAARRRGGTGAVRRGLCGWRVTMAESCVTGAWRTREAAAPPDAPADAANAGNEATTGDLVVVQVVAREGANLQKGRAMVEGKG